MRIIILGAGQVGGTLAGHLSGEANDITVIDSNADRLRNLQERFDIRTICGSASLPQVLSQAGAHDADMLVAVTSSDEINMIACQVGLSLFAIPNRIARVREPGYLQNQEKLFNRDAVPVDVLISPETLVTQGIIRLLEYPGALQVLDFAEGRLQLIVLKVRFGGALVGQTLATLHQHIPDAEARIMAVYRQERALDPDPDTVIEAGDEVFVLAVKDAVQAVMAELQRLEPPYRRILIAGGGNIGARLAAQVEQHYQVKVIEQRRVRCEHLSPLLPGSIILHGNASDRDLLIEEGVGRTDVFLALTNDDEANIMSSMLAKKLGARTVITLINNPAYIDLVQGGLIDIALSPQQSTLSGLLSHVRRGDMAAVHTLRRGAAEVLEVVVHGDPSNSRVVGKSIARLSLPEGTRVGALLRNDEVMLADSQAVIEDGDHLILFLADKTAVRQVEKLFQVGLGYL
ncbi:Trk system potassium transporter TrkA [Halopseudomonas salegens]|uniref:Trk system potassium uptake protein TrkA n=1 Tax=Halopseudomonas salegens TaxID=1434072 RepID=A0A1H2HXZ4_9GAMM|nr:Trk system potassium transporter TrkA [Halopseudomonas salegens]SDU36418.1 trk system potassium uptake protein TrkA [Halopseudomonas salegens]